MNTQLFADTLKNRKRLLIILALSIALNVFLVFFTAGFAFNSKAILALALRNHINTTLSELPEERQKEIKDILSQDVLSKLRASMKVQADNRMALADEIANPVVSKEILQKIYEKIRDQTGQSQKVVQDRFIPIILSLSPEERIELADGLRKTAQQGMSLISDKESSLSPNE